MFTGNEDSCVANLDIKNKKTTKGQSASSLKTNNTSSSAGKGNKRRLNDKNVHVYCIKDSVHMEKR